MRRTCFFATLLLAWTVSAFAQVQSGNILGTIKDEQGGMLPGVTVTAQGLDATQTFVTEANGEFRFLNLAPDRTRSPRRFRDSPRLVRENVIVEVGKNVDLPMAMKVATVSRDDHGRRRVAGDRHEGHRHLDQLHR